MTRVLVTGMSGVGKSTVITALGERGHRAVDTDTNEWSCWETLPDGSRDWIWREEAIARLLAEDDPRTLFLAGCLAYGSRIVTATSSASSAEPLKTPRDGGTSA